MQLFTIEKFTSRVLEHLGVLATGEYANASDVQVVRETLEQVQEMLDWECLFTWYQSEGIPSDKLLPVRDIVANQIKFGYGINSIRSQELELAEQKAVRVLRRQIEINDGNVPAEVEYL